MGKAVTVTNLLGVQIAYCDADGKEQRAWLDLKQVEALAWTSGDIKAKSKGTGGNNKLPVDPNGPGKCGDAKIAGPIPPMCWWNGAEWVCGNEPW